MAEGAKTRQGTDTARRAVAYLRVSPRGEGSLEERYGLDAQGEAIDQWAKVRGVRIVARYTDANVGGATPPNERPGLLAAVGALRERGAGYLVVARRDRVARDVVVAELVSRLVRARGATLVSADGLSDAEGPQGELLRGIVDVFSQYERALIRDRTTRALRAKMKRGELVGSRPPYGWTVRRGKLVPDPREQWIVEQVLALRAAGASYELISRTLAAAGVLSRTGSPLDKGHLRRLCASRTMENLATVPYVLPDP